MALITTIPLSVIFSDYRPTDLLDSAPLDEAKPAALWPHVFDCIERSHVCYAPAYWARFIAAVCKRQREPIRVSHVNGKPVVVNGHHRVWARLKGGKETVRVRFVD